MLAFSSVLASGSAMAQEKEGGERTHVKVSVDGLACPYCAYGLEKKLKKVEGQQDLYIDVQEGYATFNVPSEKKPTKEELKEIVEKAGFKARKVLFSEEPFERGGERKR